jgi:hypothetical protein
MIALLALYFFGFCLPFITLVFSEGHELHMVMGRLCLVTQMVFFAIELVQLKNSGLEYFMGWNLIDFAQFWTYISYYVCKFIHTHSGVDHYLP